MKNKSHFWTPELRTIFLGIIGGEIVALSLIIFEGIIPYIPFLSSPLEVMIFKFSTLNIIITIAFIAFASGWRYGNRKNRSKNGRRIRKRK